MKKTNHVVKKAIDDAEWASLLRRKQRMWLLGNPEYMALLEKLLSLGGDFVDPRKEPDLKKILERGQEFTMTSPTRIIYEHVVHHKMASGDCHKNVVELYRSSLFPKASIATGWALSSDGLWRQHSWLVMEEGKIVETTDLRNKYYGVKLTKDEADFFCFRELDLD